MLACVNHAFIFFLVTPSPLVPQGLQKIVKQMVQWGHLFIPIVMVCWTTGHFTYITTWDFMLGFTANTWLLAAYRDKGKMVKLLWYSKTCTNAFSCQGHILPRLWNAWLLPHILALFYTVQCTMLKKTLYALDNLSCPHFFPVPISAFKNL
jgi:hypothetical protein